MAKISKIRSLLTKQIIILDGAFGTELQKKGLPGGVCPEKWCLDNPQIIQDLYASYQQAGAQIVYTCTFGANRFKLKQYGVKENAYQINFELARVALPASGRTYETDTAAFGNLKIKILDYPRCLLSITKREMVQMKPGAIGPVMDAVATARQRCWRSNWVLDLDISASLVSLCSTNTLGNQGS